MYDFSNYKTFKELFRDIYYRNMSINEEEWKEDEFDALLYSPATSDSSIDECHGLPDKELQILKKLFSYKNPEELEQALMRADTKEQYNELLNDFNIKETVLRDQIKIKTDVWRNFLCSIKCRK